MLSKATDFSFFSLRFEVLTAVLLKVQVFFGHYAVLSGKWLVTFQRIIVPSSSGSRNARRLVDPQDEP